MKKHGMMKLAAGLILTVCFLPGCDFTSAQLTGIFQDLSAVGVSTVFGLISEKGNPDDNKTIQALIDIGQETTQTAINNQIDQEIPDDPK
jgi:outer membrane lipoprotein-sorting protein